MDTDIIIVGGGPAGLSVARALAGTGLRLTILERQAEGALAEPTYDGREIALTQRSIRTLQSFGAWDRIAAEHKSPLRSAQVLNGSSTLALTFDTRGRAERELGVLVPNSSIRRALFEGVAGQDEVDLRCGVGVTSVRTGNDRAEVTLDDGSTLSARLLVAADSRMSAVRSQLGIRADINRLGRAMLVCRVEHEADHGHVATEWFDYGHTIAMLPLNGRQSSAVITLPQAQAERLAASDDRRLGEAITAMYRGRLGRMTVASTRHLYPLAITWSHRFAVPSAALAGDAAVGMHPVTAHGFNLGLQGAATLGAKLKGALRRSEDWAAEPLLGEYEAAHRRAARPIYSATNLIVRLYGDPAPPARVARSAIHHLGRRLPFVRHAVSTLLLQP